MNKPIIAIIMGSDSDLPVMKDAARTLDEFGVKYLMNVVSAHRTPQQMFEFSKNAEKKGIKVIIAAAGGAAHLPGMTASMTVLPVIGVPIKTKTLEGVDSLFSIAQMPPGIPVATVAINGAVNAALLAMEIVAGYDSDLNLKIKKYRQKMEREVSEKSKNLKIKGYKNYIKNK